MAGVELKDPRFPAVPIALEPDADHIVISENGERREHYNAIYSEYDIGRIRQGYCCIHCGESQVGHGGPFPEKCWLCKYPMKDKQAERFAQEFVGAVRVGPSSSDIDELELAEEIYQYQQRQERGLPKTSVLLPGVDF